MKIPIIYIKDTLVFSSQDKTQKSLLFSDDFSIQQNDVEKQKTSTILQEEFNLAVSQNSQSTTQIISDQLQIKQYNFYIYNPQIILQDSLNITYIEHSISQVKSVKCKQIVTCKQNWCNSQNSYNSNIIQYYVNANILVNNVMYNTFNIGRYTFDIRDKFDFFVDSKAVFLNQSSRLNSVFNIDDIGVGNKTHAISQKLQIDNKEYSVISNIDGLIVNNNIHLHSGKHRVKIKKTNTPKVFFFDINVLSPYRKQGNKVILRDLYDLNNAKFYSNYQIEQNQVKVFDNKLKIS